MVSAAGGIDSAAGNFLLRLHPIRRGAAQFYAVTDLCEACGVDAAAAGAFTAGLGPAQRHEASSDEVGVLQDQGVLEAVVGVPKKYRGPVTVVGHGTGTGAKYIGQCGKAVGGGWVFLRPGATHRMGGNRSLGDLRHRGHPSLWCV